MGHTGQQVANYFVGPEDWPRVERSLRRAGFEVQSSRRAGGTLMGVLVRQGTADASEAVTIIRQFVPHAGQGPDSTPTAHLAGYRDAD